MRRERGRSGARCPERRGADDTHRAAAVERLRATLADPAFRAIEGFSIDQDEAIVALSDAPCYTAHPNPFLPKIIAQREEVRWMLEPAMTAHSSDRPLSDLLRAAELFPFTLELCAGHVTQSPPLQICQQGRR